MLQSDLRIYGPTQEGGRWRPRWNSELYSLYNEPDIVEDINPLALKLGIYSLAHHLCKM